jgi:hypothetical protein
VNGKRREEMVCVQAIFTLAATVGDLTLKAIDYKQSRREGGKEEGGTEELLD